MINGAIELRSDTMTQPNKRMRTAMSAARVGDDVCGEDPTINELEEKAAWIMGKEAAIFVASGTMGNLVSLLAHTRPGDEIIAEENSHIVVNECGGYARLGGLAISLVPSNKGVMDPVVVESRIRRDDVHYPRTTLICIENTHNAAGGAVIPLSNLRDLRQFADAHEIKMHMDGARIFNASVALGVPVVRIAEFAESVTFCLSKGLGAPVGAIVVGSRAFVDEARRVRKLVGGGMRQAGVLAAAGLIALDDVAERLERDHRNAKRLAKLIRGVKGLRFDLDDIHTNMVYVDVSELGVSALKFAEMCSNRSLNVLPVSAGSIRMVTHQDVDDAEIDVAASILADVAEYCSSGHTHMDMESSR